MGKIANLPTIKKCDVDAEIRHLATGVSGRFYFTEHAEMRMIERSITKRQVFNVVRSGTLLEDPIWDSDKESGWKCRYSWITAGVSVTAVVKLIERTDGHCDLVITAF